MSSSGEVDTQAPPMEQPPIQASEATAEQPVAAAAEEETASKEKKPKSPAHPPYFQMIIEAILALNEKGGSSPYAIAKYIEQKYQAVLPANFRKILGLQLKNSVAKGKLIKVKASYKLSAAGRREKAKTTTKAARANAEKPPEEAGKKKKKPKTKTLRKIDNSSDSNTMTVMKTKARKGKKAAPAKLKQLKKIKAPVVRKANKASAA